MLGTNADDNDVIAVTGKVGIPIIATSGYTAQTLTSKGAAFVVASGGNSSVLANALVMKQEGVKKVGIIYVNVPGVTGGILPLAKQGLDKQGISYDLFPVAYPSPDLTPTLSAINGKKDDAILMIADPITCGAAFSAARALGFDKPFYNPVECGSDANNKLVDALKQTVHIQQISVSLSDTSDPDVTLFRTALKDAGQNPDTPDHYLMNGFQTVMNIYAAAKKAADGGQDPTQTASLVAAVKAGGLHQFLMGKNATFTCDGSALPALPALCSLNTLIGTWKGSSVTDVQPINGADALK
jgi:branched-chain amino acid transport system substrate-binding protein